MKLHAIVEAYIDYKHSLGMRFRSQAAVLRAFNRAMGDIALAEVKPESVLAFIAGTGPITARWWKTTGCLEASTVMRSAAALRRYLRSPRSLQDPRLN
jgi:hypothetical protein